MEILIVIAIFVLVVLGFVGLARLQNGPPVKGEELIAKGFERHNVVASAQMVFGIKPGQVIFVQTGDFAKIEMPVSSIGRIELSSRRYWNGYTTEVFTVSFWLKESFEKEVKLDSTDEKFFERVVTLLHTHLPTKLHLNQASG